MVDGELRDLVLARWKDLTESQLRIAEYAIENPTELLFLGVRELALRTETSTATVVRFAQALGFSGYPALLAHLQGQVVARTNPTDRLSATLADLAVESGDEQRGLIGRAVDQDIASLRDTLDILDPDDFERAVDTLDGARIAYVAGLGLSAAAVTTLEFRLQRLAIPVIALTRPGADLYNALLPLTAGDVLVAIGSQPVPEELLRAAELAASRSAPVVAVTDTQLSPLHPHATVALHAKRGPITKLTSVVAPVAVANAIAVALAARRRDAASRAYATFENLAGGESSGGRT
ncbi:MAG: MurR/RpiR family transcriptional regulator [Nitriliruptorales bacterium]